MLLAIDIGNSSIHCGVFDAELLRHEWRMETVYDASANWFAHALRKGVEAADCAADAIDGVAIGSVVPPLATTIAIAVQAVVRHPPLFVTHRNAGVAIGYPHPEEIGADRLINAAAAIEKYGGPCIVVDFGTATTLDYINPDGAYYGGPIAPGIGIGNAALANAAAKLQPTPLASTDRLIPQSTAEAIQAGVFHGHVGLTEHLIGRLQREVGTNPKVIATGGLAALIAPHCPAITTVDSHLTLEGLRTIWTRNKKVSDTGVGHFLG